MTGTLPPKCSLRYFQLASPLSIKTMAARSYPRSSRHSCAAMVVEMPPRRPSPTKTPGSRKGLQTSHCSAAQPHALLIFTFNETCEGC